MKKEERNGRKLRKTHERNPQRYKWRKNERETMEEEKKRNKQV
jgi:hypothetical protein